MDPESSKDGIFWPNISMEMDGHSETALFNTCCLVSEDTALLVNVLSMSSNLVLYSLGWVREIHTACHKIYTVWRQRTIRLECSFIMLYSILIITTSIHGSKQYKVQC